MDLKTAMSTSPVTAAPTAKKLPAGPLWVGLGVLSLWCGFIAALTFLTSYPITLNWKQVSISDVVLEGQLSADGSSVEPIPGKPWPFETQTPVVVSNLAETSARAGKAYLFPLTRKQRGRPGYFVTPSQLPNGEPLVYPVTDESLAQLQKIDPTWPHPTPAQ